MIICFWQIINAMKFFIKEVINRPLCNTPFTVNESLVPKPYILSFQGFNISRIKEWVIIDLKVKYFKSVHPSRVQIRYPIKGICFEPVTGVIWVCASKESGTGDGQTRKHHVVERLWPKGKLVTCCSGECRSSNLAFGPFIGRSYNMDSSSKAFHFPQAGVVDNQVP